MEAARRQSRFSVNGGSCFSARDSYRVSLISVQHHYSTFVRRWTYLAAVFDASSIFAIVFKCTISGPSATRIVRRPVHILASRESCDTPCAPWT